jgi:transposase-like protein
MAVIIGGRQFWLWRAVDDEGEVLDLLVQRRRDKAAAVKLMRKLLNKYAFVPERLVTDDLRSYSAAVHDQGPRNADAGPGARRSGEAALTTPCLRAEHERVSAVLARHAKHGRTDRPIAHLARKISFCDR